MEKLKGVDALSVVYKRFSDGCEVTQCILEFYREMAEVEHSYASRLLRLLESSNYTFHSNILMQWLGSGPFEERGTVKRSWQKMGTELTKLAGLHAEKAENFTDTVRKPLQELLPQLEEERRVLKQRKQEMETELKNAEKRFQKARKNYFQSGDNYAQLKSELEKTSDQVPGFAPLRFTRSANQLEKKISDVEREFKENEDIYTQTHRELLELQQSLNEQVVNLLAEVQTQELNRVNTIAKSLQEFAKTLSNTAPAYLEGMQRIVFSVDEVDGTSDIESFVSEHPDLQCPPIIPQLELHSCSSRSPDIDHKTIEHVIRQKDQPIKDTGQYQVPSATEQPKLDPPLADSNHRIRPDSIEVDPTHSTVDTTLPATPKSKPSVLKKPVHLKQPKENSSTRQESHVKDTKESPSRERSDSQRTPQQQLYHRLIRQSQLNDYYGLLGVQPTANQEELARARREVTSRLHPDHFSGNPGQQTKAQEKLVLINQAFTDVLRQPANKQLYDQLCRYREKYHRILDQDNRSLELAKTKLSALHSSMKRARFPLSLLEEVQLTIELIEKRIEEQNQ